MMAAAFLLLNERLFPSPDLDDFALILSKGNSSRVHIAAFQEQGARKCLNCSMSQLNVN